MNSDWAAILCVTCLGVLSDHVYYKLVDGKAEVIKDYQPPVSQSTHEHEAVPEGKSSEGTGTKKDDSLAKRDDQVHELYTVSSPQLLHLDLKNRPLWFSGWILDDKYDENKHVNVSTWDVYLSEVKETHEAAEWRIGGHNMATLKSNKAYEFTQKEKDVLKMIVETARENGALKPGQ